jgi:DNA primase
MPGVNFDVLRERIRMGDVLRLLEFEACGRQGDELRGPCPVHGSSSARSRSFAVNVRKGRYCCHRCGSRGNAMELWAAVRKVSVYAAGIELCRSLGLEIPWICRW